MTVYMIFKYSKRFRYAPSFNNITLVGISINLHNSKTVYAESMIHTFSKRSEANLSVVILVNRGVVDKKKG